MEEVEEEEEEEEAEDGGREKEGGGLQCAGRTGRLKELLLLLIV